MLCKTFTIPIQPARVVLTRRATPPLNQGRSFQTTNVARQEALSAPQAAKKLESVFENETSVRRQVLDANQLQKLCLTLGRRELDSVAITESPPKVGTPVPPGWHLIYFTPSGLESELGVDGTDRTFNSPAPFTRRMWAGGRMRWQGAPLRVGDEVEERTRFVSATAKTNKAGQEMIIVEIEKEFWGPMGLSLVDQRSWVFQPEIQGKLLVAEAKAVSVSQEASVRRDESVDGQPRRHLLWSPVGLFRFSALTFNAHKIHYNQDWARRVEGHPAEVVHGPLNLISMLDYWRDYHGSIPREISYRAMSPIYVGQSYLIRTERTRDAEGGRAYDVVVDRDGTVCMKGEILGDQT